MFALIQLFVALVSNRFKSPRRLKIEYLYLRHQLNIALRPTWRLRLEGADRALLVWMTWIWPTCLACLASFDLLAMLARRTPDNPLDPSSIRGRA